MKIPEPYRGVTYSISDSGNGKWEWKLHRKITFDESRDIISGEVDGTQETAIAAAEAAIDKLLGGNSN